MSQHNPGPQQWGQQPQGYGQHPGFGQPSMPPQPKKSNAGKIVGFGCLGIIGLFVLIGIIAAVAGGSSDDGAKDASPATVQKDDSKPEQKEKEAPAVETDVKLSAKATEFVPGVLHNGGDFTSVEVTIENATKGNIDVNPLYFSVTDTNGTKHNADALGQSENQIDTLKLAPGENVTGVITAEGKFKAKSVTYTDGLIGESYKADVK